MSASQTIRAIAVDPVGNASAPATHVYVIAPIPAAAPAPGGSTGGSSSSGSGFGSPAALAALPAAPVVAGVKLTSAVRPAVRGLTIAPSVRVRRLQRAGLRLSMSIDAGAVKLRIAVHRIVGARRSSRPVHTTVRTPDASQRFVATLTSRAIRGLRPGLYEVAVTPVDGAGKLGSTVRHRFRVVR